MQFLLTLAYDGTAYAGWQRQTNARSVQQVLEEALERLLARPVVTRASSRTDAGVHALGQRVAFNADGCKIPPEKFPVVLNGYLPADISATAACWVPDDFVPRFAARGKTYVYQFYNAAFPHPLLRRYSAFVPQPLDLEEMQKAARHFVGRQDFTAFRALSPDDKKKPNRSSVREIFDCRVSAAPTAAPSVDFPARHAPLPGSFSSPGRLISLEISGDGFLYNMVRIIAGTLLYVGLGKTASEEIPAIIQSRDRKRAGKTMPPEGLTLLNVVI